LVLGQRRGLLGGLLLGLLAEELGLDVGAPRLGLASRQAIGLGEAQPSIAGHVDLGDMLLGQKASKNQPSIDDRGALVRLRRDGVDPPDPGRAVGVDLERALSELLRGEAQDPRRGEGVLRRLAGDRAGHRLGRRP
jgi:hypothetical protein